MVVDTLLATNRLREGRRFSSRVYWRFALFQHGAAYLNQSWFPVSGLLDMDNAAPEWQAGRMGRRSRKPGVAVHSRGLFGWYLAAPISQFFKLGWATAS